MIAMFMTIKRLSFIMLKALWLTIVCVDLIR